MKNKFLKSASLALAMVLAVVLFAACGGGGEGGEGPVKIATKPMTEQFVLAEMLGLLIEQEGYSVEITKGIGGGTSNIHPALVNGDFDLYPEYTGTGWLMVLNHEDMPDDDTMFEELKKQYSEQFGLTWMGLYGFNNTFAIVVRNDVIEQHNLVNVSDLAPIAGELTIGAEPDFYERADGYDAWSSAYGINFATTMDIDIGLKYQALTSGEIDVTNAFTTDAQLAVADGTPLVDDKQFFQNYYASTVVREDALERYPRLEAALMKMDGILTDADMAALSYQVEMEGRDEKDVAREYLVSKGLLEE